MVSTVGRGVLIDIWSHLNKSYDPFTTYRITLQDIQDCAKTQGVQFQYGDILVIRSGWVDAYLRLSQEKREALGKVVNYAHEFVGVEQTEAVVDFLHDNYFSAVAGDQPGFEAWPPGKNLNLHGILLPLWGMPIGEMWDLEELAEVCQRRKQYEFFFASTPANVAGKECILLLQIDGADLRVGGVGSLSNAVSDMSWIDYFRNVLIITNSLDGHILAVEVLGDDFRLLVSYIDHTLFEDPLTSDPMSLGARYRD